MQRTLYVVDPTSTLHRLDMATGTSRAVGPVGSPNVTDIAFHGPTLYGVSFSELLRLDPETGAGTVVGPIGFSTNGLVVAADGTILAATTTGDLLRIDPTTGAGNPVGTFGAGLTSAGDLAIDSNGVLFGALDQGGVGVLATIDRLTGAATVVGGMGVARVYGLAFACCRLYGASEAGEILDINAASGSATVVGRNSLRQWGLATRYCCECG